MNVTGTPGNNALLDCHVPGTAVVLLGYSLVQGTFNSPKPGKLPVPPETLKSAETPGNPKTFLTKYDKKSIVGESKSYCDLSC